MITAAMSPFASSPLRCTEEQAPAGPEAAGSLHGVIPWVEGVAPAPKPLLPGYDDGVTALVAGIFILLAVSAHIVVIILFDLKIQMGKYLESIM